MRVKVNSTIKPWLTIPVRPNTPLVSEHQLTTLTARLCLMDTLGCGLEGLRFKGCAAQMGPVVEGTTVPNGAKVPGTNYQLDPIRAAWNIGTMIRSGVSSNFLD